MTVLKQYPTPKGNRVTLAYRMDTADEPMIYGSMIEDEYGIADMGLTTGDLFVDIGAYIGSVGLAVAVDYPGVRVVMIEAVPENVDVINESILENRRDEVWVYNRAASNLPGYSTIAYGSEEGGSSYQKDNRFVGNLGVLNPDVFQDVGNISLSTIVRVYGDVAMLKIDCEGCEFAFLDDPAISRVRRIVGEHHHNGEPRILELLTPTHDVTLQAAHETVGLFWAERR